MVGEVGYKYKMQTALDSLEFGSRTPNASAMIFQQEPEQDAASVYFASEEEEATWVEHLLAEPEYDDIIDTLIDSNTCAFNVPKSYFTEFSAKESVLTKSDHDALRGSRTVEDKTREKFLGGLSNGYDGNYCSISCEDYLFNIDLEKETTLHDVTRDLSCIGDVNLENHFTEVGRNCDIDVLRLSDASTSSDHDIRRIENHNCPRCDDMSTDKLLKVFRKMFGWETSIVDEQWVEHHITFDLQTQDMWDKNLNSPKCLPDSSENEGAKVTPASHENLLTAATAFASVFNFRTKPRVQHVKRREHIQWKSSAAGEAQFDSPGKWDSKIMPLSYKRSCRPTMWHMKDAFEENVKYDGRKLATSAQYMNCEPSRGGFGRRYYHKGANISLGGDGNSNAQVECIPIPPDEDKLIKMEDHLFEGCRANRAQDSDIHAAEAHDDPSYTLSDKSNVSTSEDDWIIGTDTPSDESNDSTSEDEWVRETETQGINRQRKHKYWSTPEVLKLVEGVSKYGVGRWTDIKKIFFGSSVHRGPADLKDKWRNLVNASCRRSQGRRGVGKAKKKRGSPSLPQHVLNCVRELAVIYPNSKLRRARVLPTVFVASSSKVDSVNRCFSVND